MLPPVPQGRQCSNEPKKGAGKIDPNSVLHASDAFVAFGIFIDVHLQV